MTALICTRCGDTSLTVEAAAEYIRNDIHGQLPACACEHGQRSAMPRRGECYCAACRAPRTRAYQTQQQASVS